MYESRRHNCFFLYNSRTNSFIKLSEDIYNELSIVKDKEDFDWDSANINANSLRNLIKAKVIIDPFEDENFIIQKKMVRYMHGFQRSTLGIVLLPTFACNFRCTYCYESDLPRYFMSEITENKVIEFIKSFENCSNLQLCWHGGEPLIAFENVKRFLSKIERDDLIKITHHSMVSNGYLLDREKCVYLSDHKLDSIQITIDGLKENHDKSRIHKLGFSTFDTIINNIENVFQLMPKCHVIIRMNVHAENEADFPLLYEYLKSKWGNQNYSINMKYANDHNNGCRVECFKDRDKIFYAKKLYDNYKIENIGFYPKPKIGGCAATYINTFVIDPKGYIYKCWVDVGKPERRIGNISEKKFNAALMSEYIMGTDMFSDPKCLDCLLLPICDGGCNLRRLDYKLKKIPYDVCPIDIENLDILFDMFYEQQLKTKMDQLENIEINPMV